MDKKTIIIADNQDITRLGLKTLLRMALRDVEHLEVKELNHRAELIATLKENPSAVVVIDYTLSLTLIKTVMKDSPELASILGNVAGFIFTFLTNTFWNFKVKGKFALRAASYGGITLLGMGISTLCIHLLKNVMPFAILKLLVLVFVSAIQFVLNKLITYNDKIIKSDNK